MDGEVNSPAEISETVNFNAGSSSPSVFLFSVPHKSKSCPGISSMTAEQFEESSTEDDIFPSPRDGGSSSRAQKKLEGLIKHYPTDDSRQEFQRNESVSESESDISIPRESRSYPEGLLTSGHAPIKSSLVDRWYESLSPKKATAVVSSQPLTSKDPDGLPAFPTWPADQEPTLKEVLAERKMIRKELERIPRSILKRSLFGVSRRWHTKRVRFEMEDPTYLQKIGGTPAKDLRVENESDLYHQKLIKIKTGALCTTVDSPAKNNKEDENDSG